MAKVMAAATGVVLAVAAAGCLGGHEQTGMPKRFPAEAAPTRARLIGCGVPPHVECRFLVPGDSHETYLRLARQVRGAGWGRFTHVRRLGEDTLVAWKGAYEMRVYVSPAGARVSPNEQVPRLPEHVPVGSGLVHVSWGRAEDGR
jgi:hypothetical protein